MCGKLYYATGRTMPYTAYSGKHVHDINHYTQPDIMTVLFAMVQRHATYLGTVGIVLVDTELQVLAELLVELLEVLALFSKLRKQLKALLDEVLTDNLKNLVLLKDFTADVKRKIDPPSPQHPLRTQATRE